MIIETLCDMRYILQLLPEHNANKGIVLICMMMMENTSLQKHYLTYYNYYQYTKLNIMHVMRHNKVVFFPIHIRVAAEPNSPWEEQEY